MHYNSTAIYITCTQFARQFIHAACNYSIQFNEQIGVGMDTRGGYVFRSFPNTLSPFSGSGCWINVKTLSFLTSVYPAMWCSLCFKSAFHYSGNGVLDIVCVHIQRCLLMR